MVFCSYLLQRVPGPSGKTSHAGERLSAEARDRWDDRRENYIINDSLSRHCKVFPDAPRTSSHSLLVYLWQYSPTPFHRHSTPWSMHEMCSQDVRPFFGDLQIIIYLFTTDSLESHWQARSRKSVYLGGHPTCISPCCVIVRHRAMPSLMGPFPLLHCNSGLRIHVYVALSQWKNMQERQPQEIWGRFCRF